MNRWTRLPRLPLRQALIRSLGMKPEPVSTLSDGIEEALNRRRAARPDRQRAAGVTSVAQRWPGQ